MTIPHIASTAFFVGAIGFACWAIADSFRKEWPSVRRTFGFPPAPTHAPRVEAASRPADRPPVVGGALEEAR